MIQDMISEYKRNHDKFTSNSKILTDKEWEEYISEMETIRDSFNGTTLQDFASKLWMAFLDDTEYMQKRLKKVSQ